MTERTCDAPSFNVKYRCPVFQTRQLESSPSTHTSRNSSSSRSRTRTLSSVTLRTRRPAETPESAGESGAAPPARAGRAADDPVSTAGCGLPAVNSGPLLLARGGAPSAVDRPRRAGDGAPDAADCEPRAVDGGRSTVNGGLSAVGRVRASSSSSSNGRSNRSDTGEIFQFFEAVTEP